MDGPSSKQRIDEQKKNRFNKRENFMVHWDLRLWFRCANRIGIFRNPIPIQTTSERNSFKCLKIGNAINRSNRNWKILSISLWVFQLLVVDIIFAFCSIGWMNTHYKFTHTFILAFCIQYQQLAAIETAHNVYKMKYKGEKIQNLIINSHFSWYDWCKIFRLQHSQRMNRESRMSNVIVSYWSSIQIKI